MYETKLSDPLFKLTRAASCKRKLGLNNRTKVSTVIKMAIEKDPVVEDSDDSNDDDYIMGCEDNLPSEEEYDGEPEDDIVMNGDIGKSGCKRKTYQENGRSKRTKGGKRGRGVTAVEEDDDDDDYDDDENKAQGITKCTEEDEKKKTDSLWSDFVSDTESSVSPKQVNNDTSFNSIVKNGIEKESLSAATNGNMVQDMVTITEVVEFAGEEVKINKKVLAGSPEAKNASAGLDQQIPNGFLADKAFWSKEGCKPANGIAISSILGKIGKKSKIGTLEKSKLDWERYKSSKGLDEDIQVYNRGRDGFLDKQEFLQRADVRQFEIEKRMRKTTNTSR